LIAAPENFLRQVKASPGAGGSAYPVGAETNHTGLMLPEGSHLLVYYQHSRSLRCSLAGVAPACTRWPVSR